ncbi:16S rRNA (adenine(1518)-N(6)/adenine(1519)-N(6))-dimethyltransferaseRsmA [soil metagenome]|nr:16S rRNA (adenine(1518)-N(6)/adenine(1519)-N(6))-dimethyltransferase RsmA [Deinococcota bacterium]
MTGPLYSPAVVRDLLSRYGLRPDKAFGQNFLIDGNILARIVEAARLEPGDTVLEIGPGLGVLTRELAARAREVVSVELDGRLLSVLNETLADCPNVRLVHADGLTFDLDILPRNSLLVANLPYNVGTAMLTRALVSGRFRRLVCLLQKEVARRLTAAPGSELYGALSLLVAHFAAAEIVREVPPLAFLPAPEVTSSVVRLEVDPAARPAPELFRLIHQGFRHRRKTLKRNLVMAGRAAGLVEEALEALGLDARVRAEALSLEQFGALRQRLDQHPREDRV